MLTIHKYPLPFDDSAVTHSVEMPAGAWLRHADVRGSDAFVWAEVDPDADTVERRITVLRTGVALPEELGPKPGMGSYVGTVLVMGVAWHVYDQGEVTR
jgi:hypothetical protein